MSAPVPSGAQALDKPQLITSSDKSPPPSYAANDPNDDPDITAAFSYLTITPSRKPTVHQCIAHLKLLEAFHQLREDIAVQDGLFGIYDDFIPDATLLSQQKKREHLTKIREKRWAIYVTKATFRFLEWWTRAVEPEAQKLKQRNIPCTHGQSLCSGDFLSIKRDSLPPLDVIMVWHAYMLNPRDFFEDCLRFGKMNFWEAGLPWAAIDTCINNDTFEYNANDLAIGNFEKVTECAWNNLDHAAQAQVQCPECSELHSIPWTGWNARSAWMISATSSKNYAGETTATGFADKSFSYKAPCGLLLTHDLLKRRKLHTDIEALRYEDVPMPGTLLNVNGLLGPLAEGTGISRYRPLFPNRLILGNEPSGISSVLYSMLHGTTSLHTSSPRTISDVRKSFEINLRDRDYVRKANSTASGNIHPEESAAIRRMLSRYWENSSPFGLDLVGAVIRQGTFIERTHTIDWLHSPALHTTMNRLLTKYDRYFSILSKHPHQIAVPTLDIDLAWHTHQLSPPTYYTYSLAQTNKFVNHDDKIEETILSNSFEWTSKTYQKMFGEVYSECTCWYCEAIRESHTSSTTRNFTNKTVGGIDSQLSRLHHINSPHASPHISSHNAIKCPTQRDPIHSLHEAVHARKLLRNSKRAAQRFAKHNTRSASQDGISSPSGSQRERERDDPSACLYAYGVPLYVPYYAPYTCDPCLTPGFYASNPSCGNLIPGAVGNCVAGTCAPGGCAGGDGGDGGCGGGCGGG